MAGSVFVAVEGTMKITKRFTCDGHQNCTIVKLQSYNKNGKHQNLDESSTWQRVIVNGETEPRFALLRATALTPQAASYISTRTSLLALKSANNGLWRFDDPDCAIS